MTMALSGGARSGKHMVLGIFWGMKSSTLAPGQQHPSSAVTWPVYHPDTQAKASLPPKEEECLHEASVLTLPSASRCSLEVEIIASCYGELRVGGQGDIVRIGGSMKAWLEKQNQVLPIVRAVHPYLMLPSKVFEWCSLEELFTPRTNFLFSSIVPLSCLGPVLSGSS